MPFHKHHPRAIPLATTNINPRKYDRQFSGTCYAIKWKNQNFQNSLLRKQVEKSKFFQEHPLKAALQERQCPLLLNRY